MSQLADIASAQRNLEESFTRRMAELEAQIHGSAPAKDTVARIAEEFRTFRELMFSMLGLLRQQINECAKITDSIETRHRRKAVVFSGIPEADKEDCTKMVLNIIDTKLAITGITASSIKACHRLGSPNKERSRPILVRFSELDLKSAVWRAKTKLKGSSITVREFLTKARQTAFAKARLHFGMRACWTQDGVIVIKVPNGDRLKITSIEELSPLMAKHPKVSGSSAAGSRSGVTVSGKQKLCSS